MRTEKKVSTDVLTGRCQARLTVGRRDGALLYSSGEFCQIISAKTIGLLVLAAMLEHFHWSARKEMIGRQAAW